MADNRGRLLPLFRHRFSDFSVFLKINYQLSIINYQLSIINSPPLFHFHSPYYFLLLPRVYLVIQIEFLRRSTVSYDRPIRQAADCQSITSIDESALQNIAEMTGGALLQCGQPCCPVIDTALFSRPVQFCPDIFRQRTCFPRLFRVCPAYICSV
ncbi:MAG: hypothetical protein LBT46_14865 [Planctomycetaceae bacterium]|jgi:hypothetical protein|nr:hypothetical protein [Planctomycetaceae bacterium]